MTFVGGENYKRIDESTDLGGLYCYCYYFVFHPVADQGGGTAGNSGPAPKNVRVNSITPGFFPLPFS